MFFGAAYSAAKAGVVSLGQTGRAGARRARHPGDDRLARAHRTPLVAPMTSLPEVNAAFMDRIPLRRAATPEDIAATALFLASDEAAYVTGVNVFVDGGWEQSGYPDLRAVIARIVANAESEALAMTVGRRHDGRVADASFEDPRLAQVYDPLDPDRSDLDVSSRWSTSSVHARCSTSAAARARSPARSRQRGVDVDGRRSGGRQPRRGSCQARCRGGALAAG